MIIRKHLQPNCAGVVVNRILHFHKATGVGLDDLIQHAYLLAEQANQTHNPHKSAFTSWLWRHLTHGLFWYCKSMNNAGADFNPDLLFNRHAEWCPRKALDWKDRLSALSPPAKTLVNLILNCPEKLGITGKEAPKTIRGKITRHLRLEVGWTHRDVLQVIRELKEMLQ